MSKATRWEYKVLTFKMNDTEGTVAARLASFGAGGWELVATRPVVPAVGSDWGWLAIMKRPDFAGRSPKMEEEFYERTGEVSCVRRD